MSIIDFENIEVKSAGIYFKDDEKLMELTPSLNLDEQSEKYKYNKLYKAVNWSSSMEIEINNETLGEDMLKTLGLDTSKFPDKCDIQYTKIIQKRKHKKKRINKKWLKRYGVKQILVETKGWEVHTKTDGSFEFINKNKKEINKIK